ncbi:MAG: methyltransferase, type 12 [Thermomicrobiales bacterium]|nr:methyltransferase, type 12 [Thermomicrobiales bacterium]
MVAVMADVSADVTARSEALAERLFQATLSTWDIATVYLGHRLGLYRALSDVEPATSKELATATGLTERYVREWLEQQTVAGILESENPDAGALERRFAIPAGHAAVLVDSDDPGFLAPLAQITMGALAPMEALLSAFRTGAGVPYADYGLDLRTGQAEMNRNLFLQQLGSEYLPAIPALHARLLADPPARVADIGCGVGWSCIGIAQAYPNVRVDGFDLDAASVAEAQDVVRAAGLSDRVEVHLRDASDPALAGHYDLVTAFECVHDMSDPVGALRTMRRLAAGDGTVLVMDERVADAFDPEAGDVERFMYGFSVLHCLPVGLEDQPSAATGTVMRADTLRGYATVAGFGAVDVLPMEHPFFRFYRLLG